MIDRCEKKEYYGLVLYFITFSMPTVTVPLSPELFAQMQHLLDQGKAANKADLFRKAFKQFAEDQAVQDVLEARKEPRLRGDLRTLAQMFV
jgi:Arc/MetJ-type ribon-helix-helix transcriptional regulator